MSKDAVEELGLNREYVFDLVESGKGTATVIHVLAIIAAARAGESLYDPDTLGTEISEMFKDAYSAAPGPRAMNKLQAMITAVTTDAFENDPEGFVSISNSLSGGAPGMDFFSVLTYPDALSAVAEVKINRGGDIDPSPSVMRLIKRLEGNSRLDPEDLGEETEAWMDGTLEVAGLLKQIREELEKCGFAESVVDNAFRELD